MDGTKSKFTYGDFGDGYHHYAVNADKFTKKEAEEIYAEDFNVFQEKKIPYIVEKSYVKWRAGINGDNEPQVGYWFDYDPHLDSDKRVVPVWAFRYDYEEV